MSSDYCRICGKHVYSGICASCYDRVYGFNENGKAKK